MIEPKHKACIIIALESIAIVIEVIVIAVLSFVLLLYSAFDIKPENETVLNELSPCGKYTATIIYDGTAGSFSDAMYNVNLRNNEGDCIVSGVKVYVSDDGSRGAFVYEWGETYLKITFDGDEQISNTIILPFEQEPELR